MTAVILAAGTSTRLRPLTDRTPKCLLGIDERPILARLLDALSAAGLERAVVVTGYLSAQIEAFVTATRLPLPVQLVRNDAYAVTNNAASLLAARNAAGAGPFLVCDGDVVFSTSPLPALIAAPEPCALAVDPESADAEAMKVELGEEGLVKRIAKNLRAEVCAGESIGVQKVGGAALPVVWDALSEVVRQNPARAYYEEAFQRLIDSEIRFGTSPVVPGSWTEIDTAGDLEAARRMLHRG